MHGGIFEIIMSKRKGTYLILFGAIFILFFQNARMTDSIIKNEKIYGSGKMDFFHVGVLKKFESISISSSTVTSEIWIGTRWGNVQLSPHRDSDNGLQP